MLERELYKFKYSENKYVKEISNAKTFGFISEWENLKSEGYALGSSTNNTIVFDSESLINPPLRYPNECVRHKILDFIAAISFLDYRIEGSFYLYQSGHAIDVEFINVLHSALVYQDIKHPYQKMVSQDNYLLSLVEREFGNIF